MTKSVLIFPAFSSRFQVFIQRGAAFESGLTVARFLSTNHNSLLRIATNEIASICINHRSRQMSQMDFFFVQRRGKSGARAGQKAGFRVMLKHFEIKKAFRYYYVGPNFG